MFILPISRLFDLLTRGYLSVRVRKHGNVTGGQRHSRIDRRATSFVPMAAKSVMLP